MSATTTSVELQTLRDTRFAAALHARCLPNGFFARLGVGFLARYYASFVASPHAAAVVARLDGEPVGVLVGTIATQPHWGWVVRRRGPALGVAAALAMLLRPAQAAFFLRTRVRRYARAVLRLARRSPRPASTAAGTSRQVAVLTHVCVAASARGTGVGRALVDDFVDRCRSAGADEVQLITASDAARAFYERLGWTSIAERDDHDGRTVTVLRRTWRGNA